MRPVLLFAALMLSPRSMALPCDGEAGSSPKSAALRGNSNQYRDMERRSDGFSDIMVQLLSQTTE